MVIRQWKTIAGYDKYRVIHKSLRVFRPLRYSSRDGHAEGEHVNKWRDTQSFCPTLQVLDMSTLGDVADVNPVIKFLPHTLQHLAVDSSHCLHDPLQQNCVERKRRVPDFRWHRTPLQNAISSKSLSDCSCLLLHCSKPWDFVHKQENFIGFK